MDDDTDIDVNAIGFDISGGFEIPVEWDVLEAHSEKCLNGFAPNYVDKEVIKQKSVSTTYRIWQEDLGELGTVEIIKLRDGFSEIVISGVPMDSVNNSPMWLKIKPEWDKKKSEALKSSLSEDEYWAVSEESDKAMAGIAAKQKNHQAGVVTAYFNRLIQEVGIWKPNFPPPYILAIGGFDSVEDAYKRGEYFGDFIKDAWEASKPARADPGATQDGVAKPEKALEDTTGWDLTLIEMWNKGHSRDEIANRVNVSKDRVTNRVTELRNKFGENIVPYNKDRKKRLIKS